MSIADFSLFIIILGLALALFAALIGLILRTRRALKRFLLSKHKDNPAISPPEYGDWDAVGTFNPAAVSDDSGKVHMVYRAIGADGISRFGYARSEDGSNFSDRSPYPIFVMQTPRNGKAQHFDPVMYPSGGSWGGAEDPRMVRMDGKIYLTFNAFDGWDFIRMAVSSIDENDFFNKKWRWSVPIFISVPKTISKNWVLFPEKINGKFAILHSIAPKVCIEYVDSLDRSIQIWSNRKYGPQPGRKYFWDNLLRGAGPPPIKTERGWLLLYHAHTHGDPRYKLGAMLLNLNNPEEIIARSDGPMLQAEEWYENDWKPGIIYATGAVVRGDDLYVYYGGGDKHICVAHTPLQELLDSLKIEN